MSVADRKGSYKHSTKGSEELRARRHEVTVELRKNKKEDQLLKRRNITEEDFTSPVKDANTQVAQSPPPLTMDQILAGIASDKPFAALQAVRKALSRERNPPIDEMIGLGMVEVAVRFLDRDDSPDLQFEAAWVLTNIASGTVHQTQRVIDSGAIPVFVRLLKSPSANVAEQAVWALGNISGDGATARDLVINNNAIESLLTLVETASLSFLRNIVWLMSNLCRNKNPAPPFNRISVLLPIFANLLQHADRQILADASWAISYLTDEDNDKIQAVIDAGCVPHLVRLLDCNDPNIIVPALRSVGNIVTGNDHQTDVVLNAGVLMYMKALLTNQKPSIVKEAAWTVSNITAGNSDQIQKVYEADLVPYIMNVLKIGDNKSQREAAWAVSNITTSGTPEQVMLIVQEFEWFKAFTDLLAAVDARTVKVILTGLANVFQMAQKHNVLDAVCTEFENTGGLDKLENLQSHQNEEIYKRAYYLIDMYFSDNEDQTETLVQPAINEQKDELQFGANMNTPAGGFNF